MVLQVTCHKTRRENDCAFTTNLERSRPDERREENAVGGDEVVDALAVEARERVVLCEDDRGQRRERACRTSFPRRLETRGLLYAFRVAFQPPDAGKTIVESACACGKCVRKRLTARLEMLYDECN